MCCWSSQVDAGNRARDCHVEDIIIEASLLEASTIRPVDIPCIGEMRLLKHKGCHLIRPLVRTQASMASPMCELGIIHHTTVNETTGVTARAPSGENPGN